MCHAAQEAGAPHHQGHSVLQLDEIRSEKKDINLQLNSSKKERCNEHEKKLSFYCETCDQLVCHYCTIKDHAGHKHDAVKKMAKQHLDKMDEVIKPVDDMIDKLTTSEKKVSSTIEKIELQAAEVEQESDSYFDQVEQTLKQQRKNLKQELREVSAQKKKAALLQLQQLKHNHVQLECSKKLSEVVKIRSDNHEALFMKKQITEDVNRLDKSYQNLDIEPVELANMNFSKEHEHSFPFFGNLSYGDNSTFDTAIAYIPAYGQVGKEVKLTIITKDDNHHPSRKGEDSKIAAQAKPKTGDVITARVEKNEDGSYTASFVPTQPGKVEVSATINEQNINEKCPFNILIRQHTKHRKTVDYDGKMGEPWGIAFGKDGVWAVADHSNHCVCIFDDKDQVAKKFGSNGNGNSQFSNPRGLAFDASNHLYVVDHNNNRVQKFDIDGGYLLQFGNKGSGDGQLSSPAGITVYSDKVYVADQGNNRISVFLHNSQYSNTFGSDHLDNPYDVAVTSTNQVLVTDYGHHCISIFTLDGDYVDKIGTQGSDGGQLSNPFGLAIDLYDFILVTELGNNRVSIFDKDGVFIHCFGSSGSSAGQFSAPRAIACTPNGSVYVCDYSNKRIQIFSDY